MDYLGCLSRWYTIGKLNMTRTGLLMPQNAIYARAIGQVNIEMIE